MGGEVLLRPQFVHTVVEYATQKGFWVEVPTNGRLMRHEVIDRLADAGVATFNLAVDSVADRKELPKALQPIVPYFDYANWNPLPTRRRLPQAGAELRQIASYR